MTDSKKKTTTAGSIKASSTPATTQSKLQTPKPVAPAPNPVRKAKPRYVRLRNTLSQIISCSVVNDAGRVEELKLFAQSTSDSVREDRLTDHTKTLIAKGHIRVGG